MRPSLAGWLITYMTPRNSLFFPVAAGAALVFLVVACTETVTTFVPIPPEGGGAVDPTDGGPEASEASVPVLTPKAECERYLTCVNQQSPGEGGAAVALYGDASPCWKGSTADAQQCGDACRTARVAVANDGTVAPACGCTSDAECGKTFCHPEGACASAEWGLALAECKAVQAKNLKPTERAPASSCWAGQALRCDAIKTLKRNSGYRVDSRGESVSGTDLRRVYECGLAPEARIQRFSILLGADVLPASAPASCTEPGASLAVFGIACNTNESSFDLLEVHEGSP